MLLTKDECNELFLRLIGFSQAIEHSPEVKEHFTRVRLLALKFKMGENAIDLKQSTGILPAPDVPSQAEIILFTSEAEFLFALNTANKLKLALVQKIYSEVELSIRKARILQGTNPFLGSEEYAVLSQMCRVVYEHYSKEDNLSFGELEVAVNHWILGEKFDFMSEYVKSIQKPFHPNTPLNETILNHEDLIASGVFLKHAPNLLDPNDAAKYDLDRLKQQIQQESVRLANLDQALKKTPSVAVMTKSLSMNFVESGCYTMALIMLERVTQMNPDDEQICINLRNEIIKHSPSKVDDSPGTVEINKPAYDVLHSALMFLYDYQDKRKFDFFKTRKLKNQIKQYLHKIEQLGF